RRPIGILHLSAAVDGWELLAIPKACAERCQTPHLRKSFADCRKFCSHAGASENQQTQVRYYSSPPEPICKYLISNRLEYSTDFSAVDNAPPLPRLLLVRDVHSKDREWPIYCGEHATQDDRCHGRDAPTPGRDPVRQIPRYGRGSQEGREDCRVEYSAPLVRGWRNGEGISGALDTRTFVLSE